MDIQHGSVIYLVNPLTTNDDYSRYRNSAACYQLAQSVLTILLIFLHVHMGKRYNLIIQCESPTCAVHTYIVS